ncbi:hypothetical protein ASPNIDRAFT_44635 [Aspergillus niger ATCC 1015]|uniref:Uncharacterized protein n=1 Tax=Aspergillus niger (strain ATCC 1015 / CBS 113.46 / FGSC A1144 / LSHB Ac4 / NCTC 3858a / NRRL 328 / USDA 3528.7) TaxID=380704 RepID=G3Y7W8_ASPNA|nr:hypothetical protein ASPNIDRAFT_44635 [Aspergillus niger ATCC 1015]
MITLRAVGSPVANKIDRERKKKKKKAPNRFYAGSTLFDALLGRYPYLGTVRCLIRRRERRGGWEYPRTSFLTHAYVNRNQLSNNPPSAKPSTRYPASLIPLVGLSTKPHLIRATSTLLFPPFAPPTVGYLDSLEPPTS